jgi:short subunit dehydrogenase-like uncharacterized protein
MEQQRDLDLVVWGATGFTGRLATAYLAGASAPFKSFTLDPHRSGTHNLRWALAGRDLAKLTALAREMNVPSSVELIVADASDGVAIEAFVRRTKVIVALAGPFVRYSDLVIGACAAFGTHYVDITGEVGWVRAAMDRFGDRARASGSCIVNFCGYDSIPSDLGTFVAVNALRRKLGYAGGGGEDGFAHPPAIRDVVAYQAINGMGGFSGGSLATGMSSHLVELSQGVDPAQPFLLGGERAGGVRAEDEEPTSAAFSETVAAWTCPFGMERINSRVVRRSAMLLDYGAAFGYREVALAPSEAHAAKAAKRHVSPIPPSKLKMMIKAGRLPKPGEGPSPSMRERCRFATLVVARAESGETASVLVSGGEAGYEETAKMACEAALAMACFPEECPGVVVYGGGFLTPSAAIGEILVARLRDAGIAFDIVDEPKRALKAWRRSASAAGGPRSQL